MKIVRIPDLPPGWKVEAAGFDACVRDEHHRKVVSVTLKEPAEGFSENGLLSLLWSELGNTATR